MKRLLAAGAAMLALAGCGGRPSAMGANSSESTEITAVGTIVANKAEPTPAPTPSETPAAVDTAGNDAAAAEAPTDAATADAATTADDHAGARDDGDGVKQH